MRNHIKNLFKHSFIFGLGESLRSITGIVLIPIYTRYLTPADYGQLELLNITVSLMLIIGFQGIGVAFLKSYSEVDKNNESLINLVSTSYFYILLSSLAICSLMFLFSTDINTFLFGEHKAPDLFIKMIAISIFSSLVSYIPFHLFRAELQSVKYIYISLANLLMQLSFNIIFVTKLNLGVKGILLGNAVSGIIALLITTLCIRKYLRLKISGKILKDLLSLGIPLVFATLSYLVMQSADRYLLQKLGSLEELGLYSLGLRFTSFLTFFVISPFGLAWGPLSFQIATKENGKDIFRKVSTYFFLCLCVSGAIIIIWAPAIIKVVVGEKFWGASNVVLPLIYACIGSAMVPILTFGMVLQKKTTHIFIIVSVGTLINFGLNLALIPKFGMMGAAVNSIITYLIINFLSYKVSQKYFYILFDKLRLLKILVILLIMSIPSNLYQFGNLKLEILCKSILTIILLYSFILAKFFDSDEIMFIRKIYYQFSSERGVINKIRYVFGFLAF